MPIIDVEMVAPAIDPRLTRALADELGHVFKAPKNKVWVRLRALPPEAYAENHDPHPPAPVFVTILARQPPEGDALERRVAFVTEAVARLTGRDPHHVHVLFQASTRGRLAFGGTLVT
jgi:phenylpyruvate tautomerase PptA (4-oxalocrotonate tautomerase family)